MMSDGDGGLARFYEPHERYYGQALSEIKSGRKQSHWMWFIFPQLRGLGRSVTSQFYGLAGLQEARDFLADPVLGPHLLEISNALMEVADSNPQRVFGHPDDMKLRSCMTLFAHAADRTDVFDKVLHKFFHDHEDRRTLSMIDSFNESDSPMMKGQGRQCGRMECHK